MHTNRQATLAGFSTDANGRTAEACSQWQEQQNCTRSIAVVGLTVPGLFLKSGSAQSSWCFILDMSLFRSSFQSPPSAESRKVCVSQGKEAADGTGIGRKVSGKHDDDGDNEAGK